MVKISPANAGDMGSIPESGRSPGEGNGNPLWYSCPGNPMDRGAWQAIVHGVTRESDTTEATEQQHMTLESMFHLQFLLQMRLSFICKMGIVLVFTSQSCEN